MYDKFEALCKLRDVTPYRVAKETGVTSSTLSQWKNGAYVPKVEKLQKIADYFDVPLEYFTGRTAPEPLPSTDHTHWIPVLGRVAAGIPAEMIEDVIDYEEIDDSVGEAFALVIAGDSMEPKLSRGDVVIVRRQEDVESGDVAVVAVNGSDATCKKIVKREDGVLLVPLNPSFDPQFFSEEEIRTLPVTILGKVIESRRKW